MQQLYVAYFGRPADPAGLANFESALAAAGAPSDIQGLAAAYAANPSVKSLIDSFGTSKESQTLYGSGSTQDFVTAVFQNVLGRAPLSAGLSYWSNAIDSGSLSKGDAALAIMDGALTNSSAQGKTDAQLVNNRLAVAASFTDQVASQEAINFYSGAAAASAARGMLSKVDSNTDISVFAVTVSSTVAALLNQPGISLVAGNTTAAIPLNVPMGVVLDSSGNMYVVNDAENTVDKIAPDGSFSILAGAPGTSGAADGIGAAARFYEPSSIAIDGKGNLYVTDTYYDTIRKITPDGVVSTVAKLAGANDSVALYSRAEGVAVDGSGNLYVADYGYQTIKKITPDGVISTVAGQAGICGSADGVGSAAQFCEPTALVVDPAGNIYVADMGNSAIRKVAPDGAVSTLAGNAAVSGWQDGTEAAAHFCRPNGLAFDNAGNLIVADVGCLGKSYSSIRKVTPAGVVSTIAGTNSAAFVNQSGADAAFGILQGLAVDGKGNIFAADYTDGSIWKVSASGTVTIFAGAEGITGSVNGSGSAVGFAAPRGIVADSLGNLYVADTLNNVIRKIAPSGQVSTFAGTVAYGNTSPGTTFLAPVGLAIDASGNLYSINSYTRSVHVVSPAGVTTTVNMPFALFFEFGTGMALDPAGNLYICDSSSNAILEISPAGTMTILAGTAGHRGSADGMGTAAQFSNPNGLAFDHAGNLYVADTNNNTIRKIDSNSMVTTVAGTAGSAGFVDGTGAAARFHSPRGIAFDPAGNMYIADSANNAIRKMTPAGVVSTVAGSASGSNTVLGPLPGAVNRPQYLTMVGANTLYVTTDNAVLRIKLP
ncbi:MAG TPA: DUF4214 domain-containing protein [Burkholderiaceae bacterium]